MALIAVEAETGSNLVALSGKISEPSRSPFEIVIRITQAMLDDRSIEDAPTSKMMPYRPLTPCNARLKVRPSRKPAFTNVT